MDMKQCWCVCVGLGGHLPVRPMSQAWQFPGEVVWRCTPGNEACAHTSPIHPCTELPSPYTAARSALPCPPARRWPTCAVGAGGEARRAEFGSLPVGRPVQQVLGHLLPFSDRSPKTDEAPSPEEEQSERGGRGGGGGEMPRPCRHLLPARLLLAELSDPPSPSSLAGGRPSPTRWQTLWRKREGRTPKLCPPLPGEPHLYTSQGDPKICPPAVRQSPPITHPKDHPPPSITPTVPQRSPHY